MSAAAELSSSLRREIYAAWKQVAKPIDENSSVDAADSEQRLCLVDWKPVRTTQTVRRLQHITDVLQSSTEQLHAVVVTVGDQQVARLVDVSTGQGSQMDRVADGRRAGAWNAAVDLDHLFRPVDDADAMKWVVEQSAYIVVPVPVQHTADTNSIHSTTDAFIRWLSDCNINPLTPNVAIRVQL